jgi:hypothetical protein
MRQEVGLQTVESGTISKQEGARVDWWQSIRFRVGPFAWWLKRLGRSRTERRPD